MTEETTRAYSAGERWVHGTGSGARAPSARHGALPQLVHAVGGRGAGGSVKLVDEGIAGGKLIARLLPSVIRPTECGAGRCCAGTTGTLARHFHKMFRAARRQPPAHRTPGARAHPPDEAPATRPYLARGVLRGVGSRRRHRARSKSTRSSETCARSSRSRCSVSQVLSDDLAAVPRRTSPTRAGSRTSVASSLTSIPTATKQELLERRTCARASDQLN